MKLIRVATLLSTAITLLGVRPVFAQIDISGTWAARVHEDFVPRLPGGLPGDYLGLPINEEARARGDAWDQGIQSMPERQCIFYTSHYLVLTPQDVKIEAESDPVSGEVIAWNMTPGIDRPYRTIWMDGRPHPSALARHTAGGFATGAWQGDTLVVSTTHLTEGIIARDGLPHSDRATVTEFWTRHGTTLTATMILDDPTYLDEPLIRSNTWAFDPSGRYVPSPCEPRAEVPRPLGKVPHHLPGTNTFLREVTEQYGIPFEAVRGGAETMYPEYRKKIKGQYVRPDRCPIYCCGGGNDPSLRCDPPPKRSNNP